jgi:hypothetical protein
LYSIERIKQKSTWFGITQTSALNDSASIANGAATTINVLSNDDTKGSIVTIISDQNGIAVVNVDKTITYT